MSETPNRLLELTVAPSGTVMPVDPDETMISAMVRSGFLIRIGCKRGGCGICKVLLVTGEVRYERPVAETVLSRDDIAAGVCLSCRAVPLTDVSITLQEGDRLTLVSSIMRRNAERRRQRELDQLSQSGAEPTSPDGAAPAPGQAVGAVVRSEGIEPPTS